MEEIVAEFKQYFQDRKMYEAIEVMADVALEVFPD